MPSTADPPTGSALFTLLRAPTDREKWGRFVYRYAPRLLGWCRRWGLQPADAEDVTQDVLTTLAVRLRTFPYGPRGRFRGYLRTLARNAWSAFVKARQRAGRGGGADEVQRLLENAAAADDLTQALDRVFDASLGAICRKAMAKEPADRCATMEALAADLQAYLEPKGGSWRWLAVAAVVLLVAVAINLARN